MRGQRYRLAALITMSSGAIGLLSKSLKSSTLNRFIGISTDTPCFYSGNQYAPVIRHMELRNSFAPDRVIRFISHFRRYARTTPRVISSELVGRSPAGDERFVKPFSSTTDQAKGVFGRVSSYSRPKWYNLLTHRQTLVADNSIEHYLTAIWNRFGGYKETLLEGREIERQKIDLLWLTFL